MAQAADAPPKARTETITYGNFRSIITGEDPAWEIGGFSLPDGSEWKYREPKATVIVEHQKLRVRANPLSRSHDRIQVLDNAKHMYFSTARFTPPDDPEVNPVLLHKLATVYGRVLFPGVDVAPPADLNRPTYFCIFNEVPVATRPGQTHLFRITYDKASDELWWFIDGTEVDHHREVPFKMESFLIALGLMTEKAIDEDRSISLHGQGLTGEWSPLTITIEHR
jgi:hypothetical protein